MPDSPRRVVIYGAGGHAKVVADLALCLGYVLVGFVDDEMPVGHVVLGARVLGSSEWLEGKGSEVVVALGLGDNLKRSETFATCLSHGISCPTFVHPRATIAASATIGSGTTVMAAAVINSEARVGQGVIINTGAVVEHECDVADFAHLSPNATLGGRAQVGRYAHVGLCSCVLPGVQVGDKSRVGAGAVVNRTVPPNVTVAGVPARVLRKP